MPDATFVEIATSLGEGTGGRRAARVFDVQPKVVYRIARKLGRHAQRVLQAYLRNVTCREVQLDELWSFLRKKEANGSELEALQEEYGDCWVWVAFDPESRVILAYAVGKRTRERCVELLRRLKAVISPGELPLFTSDELAQYEDALIEVFGVTHQPERDGTRGRFPHPIHVPTTDLQYAVVHKQRENNRIVRVTRRTVLGDPGEVQDRLDQSTYSSTVNTSGVERQNGKLRADNPRFPGRLLVPDALRLPYVIPLEPGSPSEAARVTAMLGKHGFDPGNYHIDLARNLFQPRHEPYFLLPANPRIPGEAFDAMLADVRRELDGPSARGARARRPAARAASYSPSPH